MISSFYRRRLPHWRAEGGTNFVTWRLHPHQAELTPDERTAVLGALQHFDGVRYARIAYVVMNDHVHVLFTPTGAHRTEFEKARYILSNPGRRWPDGPEYPWVGFK